MFYSTDFYTAPPLEIVPGRPQSMGRWVEAVSHLDAKYGGLSAIVPQLAARLERTEGLKVSIAAFCEAGEFHTVKEFPDLALTDWPVSRLRWLRDRELRARFLDEVGVADGIHIHGLWTASTSVAVTAAHALSIPYVLSAHGMLEPWALANGALKKRLYMALIERANVHGAACLHALTQAEARDYRRFGCRQPIAVIPNGVNIPRCVDTQRFLDEFPEVRGRRIVLFLGRLHPKKGLDLLLSSWASLAGEFSDACLVLAGPGDDRYAKGLRRTATAHGGTDSVIFTGMLSGEMKWSALANATGFVLPSYSEGFSVAALEAMGMGLPVIVSENCHLPEVASVGLGWQIEPEITALTVALRELLHNADADNAEIGSRGRRLVQERYSWQRVAHQMAELYQWVQTEQPPATFKLQEVHA